MAGVANRVAAATAAVVVKGRRSVGSAVLVDGRHLLTARHNVSDWDGQGWGPAVEKVSLIFPWVSEGEVTARPVPLPQVGATDVAVLDLGEESPAWLPEQVGLWAGRGLPDRVDVIGFPSAEKALEGVWRGFTVSGPATDGAVQLRWEENAGTLRGQSGGPVVEHDTGALVGILVEGSTVGHFDRFVPVTVIERCWPGLRRPWLFAGLDARGHVRGRALGRRHQVQTGDLFRGRTVALSKIRAWLDAEQCPGRPLVITGQPGAGKSAVLGRAALDAEQDMPGAGVVFHARDATHSGFLEAMASATGVSALGGRDELLDSLVAQGDNGLFAVMVDALDEAATAEERTTLAQTLSEVAAIPWLRVVVATRPLAAGDRYSPGSLLTQLRVTAAGSVSLLDLDVDPYSDPEALREFAAALLAQEGVAHAGPPGCAWETYRADHGLRDRLAEVIARRADPNFLVAAMTSVHLSDEDEALDPAAAGFDPEKLPSSVGEALNKYLNSLPDRQKASTRALLTALAFARGSGISDGLWLRFAHALGYTEVGKVDLDVLRDTTATDYLLQSTSEQDGVVARLFHQSLVDELLRGQGRHNHKEVFKAVLVEVGSSGGWAGSLQYGRAHAAEHAADAGELGTLLSDTGFLAYAELTRLVPVLADIPAAARPPMATLVLMAADRAVGLSADQRVRLFALTAAHLGLQDAKDALNRESGPGLRPVWAHGLGNPHQRLTGHISSVSAVALGRLASRDVVVSAGDDTVRVWDEHGAPLGDPLTGHTGWVPAVVLGRLGGRSVVVSTGEDGTVRIWDEHGTPVGAPLMGHNGPVFAVALGRLGGRDVIVSAGADEMVRIWDEHGTLVGDPLTGHTDDVNAVSLGRLGGRDVIVSAGDDTTVRIWDEDGAPVGNPLTGHTDDVHAVALGRLGGREVIVSAGADQTVRIWDEHGAPVGNPLTGHTGWVNAVAVGRLGGRDVIVTASTDQTVRIWDNVGAPVGDPLTRHAGWVNGTALGQLDGRAVIVSAGDDRTVRVWDQHGTPVGDPLTGHTRSVKSVALGRLSHRSVIVSAGHDATVRIWDEFGTPVREPLTGHTGPVLAVAVGRLGDREVIVSAGADETVRIWDEHGAPFGEPLTGHKQWVRAVALGRLGSRDVIVSAGEDVRIWDEQGALLGDPLTGHTHFVRGLAVGRLGDRDVIVSAGADRTVRIWDEEGAPLGDPLTGHTRPVRSVALGRLGDRSVIVSAGEDRTVRIWDEHGAPVGDPTPLLEGANSVQIHEDRVVLSVGSALCLLEPTWT